MNDYLDFLGNLRKMQHGESTEPEQLQTKAPAEQAEQPEAEQVGQPEEELLEDSPASGNSHSILIDERDTPRRGIKKRHIRTKQVVTAAKTEVQDDAQTIAEDKYTDRFASGAKQDGSASGKTRKLHAYSEIRATEVQTQGKTRQISVSELSNSVQETDSDTKILDEDDKAARLRAIAQSATEDFDGEQLVMPGFSDKKEDERTPEEVELEEKLSEVRKERINKFKLTSALHSGGTLGGEQKSEKSIPKFLSGFSEIFEKYNTDFSPCEGDEFTDLAQRRRIFTGLVKVRRQNLIRIIIVAALGLVLLLTNIIASAAASPTGALTVFGGSAVAYTVFNLVLFLAVCALCFDEVKKGIISILQIHPKAQGAAVLLSLAVIAQCVAAFITKKSLAEDIQLFTGAAALLYVPLLYSKVFYYDNARHCFKAISSGGEKSVIRRCAPGDGVSELVSDESRSYSVVYEGKTSFITHFLQRASRAAYAGMPSSRLILAACLAALVVGIVAAIIAKSPTVGLSAFTGCMCFTFPVSGLFASSLLLAKKNGQLSSSGSFIQSFADARDLSNCDYITVDAQDLFTVTLRDATAFSGLNEKQASFCGAALAMNAGGTLGQAFSKKFGAYRDKLPDAQDISYEEKLGLSAWVNNCRMLLGTRKLLENHNVKLPTQTIAESFTDGGTLSIYMSIEERLAAIFSADYVCDASLSARLKKLASSGTSIIVFTRDANITEHMVESKLDLPENTVRVVNSLAFEEFENSKKEVSPGENTGIVFRGGFAGLCECAQTACSLDRMKQLSKIICAGGCAAGIIIGAMVAISASIGTVSSLHIILMQAAMLVITTLLCGVSDSLMLPKRKENGRASGAKRTPPVQTEQTEQTAQPEKTETQEKGGFTGDIFKGLLTSDDEQSEVFPEL